ncbi:MAG: amino acid adenylation domain-containing protein [Arcobacter sp.]|nr:amino acid adenylation domain-containing protein [Arcobacter sp.]
MKININKYRLSIEQKNIYFLNNLLFQSQFLNNPIIFRLTGRIDLDFLESAVNLAIQNFPSLKRSFYILNDKNIYQQIIEDQFIIPFEKISIPIQQIIDEDIILEQHIKQDFLTSFELKKNPPIRAKIIILNDNDFVFLMNIHSIIIDKISIQHLLDKVSLIYNSLTSKKDYKCQPYKTEMIFASLKNTDTNSISDSKYDYYIKSFNNLEWSEIPTDFLRPDKLSYIGKSVKYQIPKKLFIRIKELSQKYDFNLQSFFLSVFYLLIYLYTESSEGGLIHVCLEVSDCLSLESLFGNNSINGKQKFLEMVKHIGDFINNLKEKKPFLFEDLFDKLFLTKNNDYISYPRIKIDFKELKHINLNLNEIKSTYIESPNILLGNDLTVVVKTALDSTELDFQYSVDLFKYETIRNLIKHFETLLDNITTDVNKVIAEYNLLDKNELLKLQYFNTTNSFYPNKTLTFLFEEQVRKTPYNIAAIFKNQQISYLKLNNKVNKIARYLKDNRVTPKSSVAIHLNTSLEVLIYILAILKVGASYVFIDPKYPLERVLYMINTSRSRVVITNLNLKKKLVDFIESLKKEHDNKKDFVIDILSKEHIDIGFKKYSSRNLLHTNLTEELAYIIFTSGSTGVPKAVMVQHNSVVNCIFAVKTFVDLKEYDVAMLASSLSFDISVIGYFLPWLSGAAVVIIDEEEQKNSELMANLIAAHNVTFMQATPTTWQMLINYGWVGKMDLIAISAGEAISKELATEIISKVYKLYNGYGPTEATIYTTISELKPNMDITIGKPLANYKVYITDKFFNLMPIGLGGELCISGVGVARGYLDDKELNKNKFIDNNPFVMDSEEDKRTFSRIYKTGDKAKYLSNGEIEYLGRIDEQIKIRGYRVNLLEIEINLMQSNILKECAVIMKLGLNYQKLLIAYIVPKDLAALSNKQIIHSELVLFIKTKLPEYMIPNNFIIVDSLPKMLSGKIDRKKLKTFPLSRPELLTPYSPARTKTEKLVHSIWNEVFQIEKIGIDDNFFDLGGYSLLVTQIYNLFKKNGVNMSIIDIFQNPTIRLFSQYIDAYN